MRTKNLLMLSAIAGIMTFASCKKDETPAPLTKVEAETAFTTVEGDYNTIKTDYSSSVGLSVLEAISNLDITFEIPSKAPAKLESIQKDFLKTTKAGGHDPNYMTFAFNEHVGTWTKVNGVWQRTSPLPSNQVVIVFSYKGGTNNATLTYYDFATQKYDSGENLASYISQLKAKVVLPESTEPVMSWVYTASRTLMGGNTTFVYTLGKYTHTEKYSMRNSLSASSVKTTIYSLFELKKDGEIVFANTYDILINTSLLGKTANPYTINIYAKLRIMNIVVRWDIEINEDTIINGNPANYMKVSVWTTNGAKVADIAFKANTNGGYDEYFEFSDGTQAPVSNYLKKLYTEIEDFVESFMTFTLN